MSGDSVTSTVRVFVAFARAGRLVLNAPTDLPDGTMLELVPVDDLLAMPVDDPSAKDSEVAVGGPYDDELDRGLERAIAEADEIDRVAHVLRERRRRRWKLPRRFAKQRTKRGTP